MTRTSLLLAVFALIASSAAPAFAQDVPAPRGFVTDGAAVIDDDAERALETRLTDVGFLRARPRVADARDPAHGRGAVACAPERAPPT